MTSTLLIDGARIDVTVEQNDSPLSQPDLLRWVQSAAESVAAYYGRFPVPHLILRVTPFAARASATAALLPERAGSF